MAKGWGKFTDVECAYLRANAGHLPVAEIARRLGRSVDACWARLRGVGHCATRHKVSPGDRRPFRCDAGRVGESRVPVHCSDSVTRAYPAILRLGDCR